MRILHLLENLNVYGGTPSKTLFLAQNSIHDHSIYTWHKTLSQIELSKILEEAKHNGILIHENYAGRNVFNHLKQILNIIDSNSIDIVHSYFHFGELLGYLVKKLRPRVKFVVSFVGANAPVGLKSYLFNIVYRSVDEVVFISDYIRSHYKKLYSCLEDRGFIIYNGSFRESEIVVTDHQENAVGLLSIGGLINVKNHKVLLKAVRILREERGLEVNLTILGEGEKREELLSFCEDLRIQSLVSFPGYKSDVVSYLNKSSVYLHPCLVEGFGIAVVEAMLAGKAIVCSKSGALPELIVNHESGLLVDGESETEWANAIELLLKDTNLRRSFGLKARQKALSDFNNKKFVASHDEFVYN